MGGEGGAQIQSPSLTLSQVVPRFTIDEATSDALKKMITTDLALYYSYCTSEPPMFYTTYPIMANKPIGNQVLALTQP